MHALYEQKAVRHQACHCFSLQNDARGPTFQDINVRTKIETPTLRWPHGTSMKHLHPSRPVLAQDRASLEGLESWFMVPGSQPCQLMHRQLSSAERSSSRTQVRSDLTLLHPFQNASTLPLGPPTRPPLAATLQHRSKISLRLKTQVESLVLAC